MLKSHQPIRYFQTLALLIYILSASIYPWLILGTYGNYFEGILRRVIIFILLAFLSSQILLRLYRTNAGWKSFIFTVLFYGWIYQISLFIPDLSTYPLSLGWSETSRYYYASLYFSSRIYSLQVPPSVLHPSRYLMQSLPFLLENSPLWLHRLWQVILWVAITSLGAYFLTWRINHRAGGDSSDVLTSGKAFKSAFIMWAFLFFFQGPIYYHLMVMVILILWGFDRERFWKSLLVVLLASLWAGISRVNWFPVPGLLASALYFLEVITEGKSIWHYLWKPFIWTVSGGAAALLAQRLYILVSGNPPELFASSFSSDLLWYRLFPNPTYPLGILPSILLVSLPLLAVIALKLIQRWNHYRTIRLLALGAILFVLFSGGIIVSLKIGGGSNLHNLDAYLVLLLVIGSYISLDRFTQDGTYEISPTPWLENKFLIAALVTMPVFYAISSGGQLSNRSMEDADQSIQTIKETIENKASGGGDVLFISQRHLLTFGDIQGISLIPDYEKVFLMEMAMSGNESYLGDFYNNLSSQRFELIITDPLKIQYQGPSHSFGEENDAWVARVSEPVLCYYEPLVTLSKVETEILIPRKQPCK